MVSRLEDQKLLSKLIKRKATFKKHTLRLSTLLSLDSKHYFKIEDSRVPPGFKIYHVDLRPEKPPVGRSDVAFVIYRYNEPVYQLVGKAPHVREQSILASLELEELNVEKTILEVLGFD